LKMALGGRQWPKKLTAVEGSKKVPSCAFKILKTGEKLGKRLRGH